MQTRSDHRPLWEACGLCARQLAHPRGWDIVAACASVGASRGRSTREMAVVYFADYHRTGHRAV